MMSRVEGLLFESDAWPGWWAQLDDFAGPDYGRVLARVKRRDCGIVTAYFVCGPGRAGSGWPKLTRPAGASPPRARHTDEYTACARALVGSRGRGRRGLVARLEEGTPPVQTPFAYGSIAIVIRHWFEIARQMRSRVPRRASIGSASCAPRNRLGITDVDHRPGAVARRLVRPRRGVNRATSVVRITTRPSPTPGRRTGRGTRGSPAT